VLALPAIARGLVRPRDPLEGGFAWLVLALVLAFSYAYYFSMNEDRYFAVLVAPIALAASVAVFRRPPPAWACALSGALVVALVASSYRWPAGGPYDYFVAPTSRFFGDVVTGKLAQWLPGGTGVYALLVPVAAGLGALLALRATRRPRAFGRPGLAAAGLVLAGVLVFQLAAMDHPARKFTQLVGMTDLTAGQLEFIDRLAAGAPVRPLAVDGVVDPDLAAQLQILNAYNDSLSLTPYAVNRTAGADPQAPVPEIDWRSGRVVGAEPDALLLQIAGAAPVGFAGEPLPRLEPFPWAQLVRPRSPLRAVWLMRGTAADRYPPGGTPVVVRGFPTHAAGRCLLANLFAHPFADGPVRYRLAGGGQTRLGVVRPALPRPLALPVSARRATTFTLSGTARRATDGGVRGPTLADLRVAPCPRR
jgi:hypothetical protein